MLVCYFLSCALSIYTFEIIREVLNKIDFSEIINFEKDIRIDEENEIIVDEKYEYNNLINVKHSHNTTKKIFDSEEEKRRLKVIR